MKPTNRKKFCVIETRDQLLDWLAEHVPTATIRRAFEDGLIVNYGWFIPVPGSDCPGWVVYVRTKAKADFFVAVVADAKKFEYRTYVLDWGLIDSRCYRGGRNPLYRGDNPPPKNCNSRLVKVEEK
jgi:hypothetical protein